MAISASDIKLLRERTGAGMMDCKKALNEAGGDYDEAVNWLRTKGLAAAAKKADRVAAEGLVGVKVEGNKGVVVEVNSETDFVARNDKFQSLVSGVASVALAKNGDFSAIQSADYPDAGRSVQDEIAHQVGVIGENMTFRRSAGISVSNGVVASYIHNAVVPNLGKIGVLVALESAADASALEGIGRQIAMHVAAARPEALTIEELDPANVARERQIYKEQAMESGKPEEIAEKMVEGRIRKYYEQVVLPQQVFVIDGKATVQEFLDQQAKELGSPIKLAGFVSFELGAGIEKKEEDFAAEVKAVAGA